MGIEFRVRTGSPWQQEMREEEDLMNSKFLIWGQLWTELCPFHIHVLKS